MFKVIAKCSKCKKETAAFDDKMGIINFDFEKAIISFICPECAEENIINFGTIQQALAQKSKLPSIRASR